MVTPSDPDVPADDDTDDDDDLLADGEQDLLVVFKLDTRRAHDGEAEQAIDALGDELDELLQQAGVGEFDGDEYGGGECTLFFCGPDVDRMVEVLRPVLRRSPLCRGGYFVRLVEAPDGSPDRRRDPI